MALPHTRQRQPEPVLRDFKNIECRDAVLAHDGSAPMIDANGQPVTRWDGVKMKTHPVTGEQVPDETARLAVLRYENPHPAAWPEADFVVGKHRTFQFLDASIAPDNMLIAIATDDAYFLGVLSSHVHVVWALAQGGTLEDRPRYNKSRCFETFPFPHATPEQQTRIRDLAEQIDAQRKRVLADHAELTLTGLYNVLVKISTGDSALNAKEKLTHEKGLVAVLKSLHDDLDAAVLDAYGWHDQPDDAPLLERLVALNTQRRAEEAQGNIRWLRPAFQNPQAQSLLVGAGLPAMDSSDSGGNEGREIAAKAAPTQTALASWPATLPEQLAAVAKLLADVPQPQNEAQIAACFTGKGKWKSRLPDLLAALATLGRARCLDDGRWMG